MTKHKKDTKVTRPDKDSIEYFIQQFFTGGLFELLKLPTHDSDQLNQLLSDRKIGVAYDPETSEYAVCYGDGTPLLILNTNAIIEQIKLSNPLKPIAEKFNGREYGNLITLEEVVELNKAGHVLITPCSDDRIEIYGIGKFANHLSDQILEFGVGAFPKEPEVSLYYCPSHNNIFITQDEYEDTKFALEPLGMTLEATPIITYQDKDRGFVIECNGIEHYPFTIMEEGDIYGVGLVVAI